MHQPNYQYVNQGYAGSGVIYPAYPQEPQVQVIHQGNPPPGTTVIHTTGPQPAYMTGQPTVVMMQPEQQKQKDGHETEMCCCIACLSALLCCFMLD